jgi:hypothetical protein
MKVNLEQKKRLILLKSFIGGLGWMMGATIGFAVFAALLGIIINWLGGLPVIGDFFAQIIKFTNQALQNQQI